MLYLVSGVVMVFCVVVVVFCVLAFHVGDEYGPYHYKDDPIYDDDDPGDCDDWKDW